MSKTDIYDKSMQVGDRVEEIPDTGYGPGMPGKIFTFVKKHSLKNAGYFTSDCGKIKSCAAYKCAFRKIDDAKSFIPEVWD